MNLYNLFCLITTICSSRLSAGTKPAPIVFPGQQLDRSGRSMQEIPLDLAWKLSNVTDIDELFENFIDNAPGPFPFQVVAARFGGAVERKAFKIAKMAKCIPELTPVKLKPETAAPGTYYFPECTRVPRCGGCCGHELLSCQPAEVETLQLQVMINEYRGGAQLSYREYQVMSVESHKSCKCDCRIKETDCKPYQKYDQQNCKCECSNHDKQEKCNDESATKLWNHNSCACECREVLDCTSGFYFDRYSCECVRERSRPNNTPDLNKLSYQVD